MFLCIIPHPTHSFCLKVESVCTPTWSCTSMFWVWTPGNNWAITTNFFHKGLLIDVHLHYVLLTLNFYRVEANVFWLHTSHLLNVNNWQQNSISLIRLYSLVDSVLQVVLQPPDLWVHTHLFVCLQLGTDQKKDKSSVNTSYISDWDESVNYANSSGILTHCYQTDWINTALSLWRMQRAFSQECIDYDQSLFGPVCDAATDIHKETLRQFSNVTPLKYKQWLNYIINVQ